MTAAALSGRRALVSGGAAGIGRATAEALAAAGASVTVADPAATAALAGCAAERIDVSRGAAVDELFARLKEGHGLPDTLVLNAGVGLYERLCEGDPDKWQRLFEVNVLGALRLVRAFVPPMLEAGGDVVFVGSVAARKPHPYGGVYAASKAALESLAETLRLETQPRVRVTTVAPGVVATGFFEHLLAGEQSLERMGCGSIAPQRVAELIVYAVSQPPEVALNHLTVRPRDQEF